MTDISKLSPEELQVWRRTPLTEEEMKEKFSQYDRFFVQENFISKGETFLSPSGKYSLEVESYSTGKGSWGYTQGIVKEVSSGETLFSIRRNYASFWHTFVLHSNEDEYLLCGEDYQGYTVVNLTKRTKRTVLLLPALKGYGFCWASAMPSPDGRMLAVDGCYWACPYEIVFFDFSNPENLPLPELGRVDSEGEGKSNKWVDNDTFQHEKYEHSLVITTVHRRI